MRSRPDSELGQAITRVLIVLGFLIYFTDPGTSTHYPDKAHAVWLAIWGYMVWSIALCMAVLLSSRISPIRRYLGMLGDTGITTYLMFATNDAGAALAFVYLWVTIGNGFRYGVRYLIACGALSVVGFSVVLFTTPFWKQHIGIDFGMMLMLVLIPLYTGFLLAKLQRAVKQAHEASLAKSNFLASMSHELRTPLNGVIGLTDLIQETRLDQKQKELMDAVQVSARTLHTLIEDVLDISRIEAGKMEIAESDFDLYAMLKSVTRLLGHQAEQKGIKLILHLSPATPNTIHGDQKRLKQILVNLVGNAIKFTDQGKVELIVHPYRNSESGKEWLRFEVADTGIGIPEDKQAHIFEPFVQSDMGISRRYGGSGLGTTISKQLVELMGGKIGLESAQGKGSTFWFSVPLQGANAPEGEALRGNIRVAVLAPIQTQHQLTDRIESWGGKVFRIADTHQAETGRAANAYDALIVDRAMLDITPGEFASAMRGKQSSSDNLHLILMDQDPSEADIHEWVSNGFDVVLRKPVEHTHLLNALRMAATKTELPDNVILLSDRARNEAGARKLHVLVAEDNPINQKVLRGLLEHAGHQVTIANNGEEALDILEVDAESINLAVFDMHMPDLSGVETVKRWRFMERGQKGGMTRHLPILILTADARVEAEKLCREAGADDFLSKPVNSRLFLDRVTEWGEAGIEKHSEIPSNSASGGTARPAPKILDESFLEGLAEFGGGMEFVTEIIEDFRSDSAKAIQEARKAMMQRDYAAWRNKLHMLKGGASDVGALAMSEACQQGERIKPFEIERQVAVDRLVAVERERERALSALGEYLDNKQAADSQKETEA